MGGQAVEDPAGRRSSKLMGEREVSEDMPTKERLFRNVCHFAQEFLILVVVDQAVYLIGACRVLLPGY